jgi:hypothetical protein
LGVILGDVQRNMIGKIIATADVTKLVAQREGDFIVAIIAVK